MSDSPKDASPKDKAENQPAPPPGSEVTNLGVSEEQLKAQKLEAGIKDEK